MVTFSCDPDEHSSQMQVLLSILQKTEATLRVNNYELSTNKFYCAGHLMHIGRLTIASNTTEKFSWVQPQDGVTVDKLFYVYEMSTA